MVEISARKGTDLQSFLDNQAVPPSVKNVVRKALNILEKTKLCEHGFFSLSTKPEIERIVVEEDAELPSWKYAVISLRLPGAGWSSDIRLFYEAEIIDAVYSRLSPHQATKILLDFSYV